MIVFTFVSIGFNPYCSRSTDDLVIYVKDHDDFIGTLLEFRCFRLYFTNSSLEMFSL